MVETSGGFGGHQEGSSRLNVFVDASGRIGVYYSDPATVEESRRFELRLEYTPSEKGFVRAKSDFEEPREQIRVDLTNIGVAEGQNKLYRIEGGELYQLRGQNWSCIAQTREPQTGFADSSGNSISEKDMIRYLSFYADPDVNETAIATCNAVYVVRKNGSSIEYLKADNSTCGTYAPCLRS